MSEKEQIMDKVIDLLRELEANVKDERPIPIVKDRRKGLVKDCTLKDWLQKLNEEVDELKDELLSVYTLEDVPSKCREMREENKKLIVGELCDVIEVLYSMADSMTIDGDDIQDGIHNNNVKLKERGCID